MRTIDKLSLHTGRAWSHHGADNDNPDGECQRCSAQNFLHEVYRHLPGRLLFYGLWCTDRIRLRGLHRQADTTPEEQISRGAEARRGEEGRGPQADELDAPRARPEATWS